MKDIVTGAELQDQHDVDLLRSLAATHFSYGGIAAALELLELARMIKPDDARTLVLSARVRAQMGDLVQAALIMVEASRLVKSLSTADLIFARTLSDRLDQ